MSAMEQVHQWTQRKQEKGKPTGEVRAVLRQQEEGSDGEKSIEHPGGGASTAFASAGISL